MRHYFGYRVDGSLGSIHTFHGGWTDDRDVCDPNCTDVSVQGIRERMMAKDTVGFICYECPCPSEDGSGDCCTVKHRESFAKDGVLVARALTTKIQLDGVDIADNARIARAPNTKLQFKVVAPDVPDGQKAGVFIAGSVLNLSNQHELTVTGGETETIELTAPAQGSEGEITVGGVQVRLMVFSLLGVA